jgi:ATP-dependent 26S proteasome regulatory subunit
MWMENSLETIKSNKPTISVLHLIAEMERIDVKLRLMAIKARSEDLYGKDRLFRGLYISDLEISTLLDKGINSDDTNSAQSEKSNSNLLQELANIEGEIKALKSDSASSGHPLRMEKLMKYFHLSDCEKEILMVAMLPEIDADSERLFSYVQDDVTRKRPTVGLILDILGESLTDKIADREFFSPGGQLLKNNLIYLLDDTQRKQAPLLEKAVKVDQRICDFLLGSDSIDHVIASSVHKIIPGKSFEDVIVEDEIKNRLSGFCMKKSQENVRFVFHFQGAPGSCRLETAEAYCRKAGINLLVVDTGRLLKRDISFEQCLNLSFREALLHESGIYFSNFQTLFHEENRNELNLVLAAADTYPMPVFLAGTESIKLDNTWRHKSCIKVEFHDPDFEHRKKIWQMNPVTRLLDEATIDNLANKFKLNNGQITGAANRARSLAIWRDGGLVTRDDLIEACRNESSTKLIQLSRKIEPKYVWDDIILPEDQLNQLKDIFSYVNYRHTVLDVWGFQHKLSLGKGLNSLFAGPSGTGKTMAAEIIAHELNIDLYKIDLALIVSKYIGETEKNLDKIFKEAQNSNSILFFDEADALFGKRSEVKDSHDRYANIEIAYLLQKMEEYQGIVILATNLRNNLDEAFARRMHFSVDFPLPEEEDRLRIWQKAFPSAAPLSDDIDLPFLARQFKITGGNIKNIALGSAFLAARDGSQIAMKHCILSTKREYQKMYKLCTESDFGKYFNLVKK